MLNILRYTHDVGVLLLIVFDGFIVAVEDSDSNYDVVVEKIHNKPTAPEGYAYKLRASDLEWELVELPPEPPDPDPEVSDAEALAIILGGAT